MVIESSHGKTEEAMCKLLQSLFRSFVITIDQMRAGFQRCYDQMVDISIDVPQAYIILERWVLRCRQAGIINDDIVKKMPSRGRKRFVSEGDGGLIKESSFWWSTKYYPAARRFKIVFYWIKMILTCVSSSQFPQLSVTTCLCRKLMKNWSFVSLASQEQPFWLML